MLEQLLKALQLQEDVWRLWGESKGFWINAGALILSVLVAAYAIYANTKAGRKRATLDLLTDRRKDVQLMDAIYLVHDWKKKGLDPKFILLRGNAEADAARAALNYYEFVALSVLQGALDEDMYKQMQCSNFLKFWQHAEPLVREVRLATGKNTFFQDMELLANRWTSNPVARNSYRYIR